MEQAELEQIIEKARLDRLTRLELHDLQINNLPDSIGNLNWLFNIELGDNQITTLPESIANLTRLMSVDLSDNLITDFSIFKSMKNIKRAVQKRS
jgi:leucine-rich repeat protein SHOC2